jgi:T4 gene Gp59 loader of gp41 DNA helicase/T4 gene Gp59 loader of gp41 DNA helicase C-term
MNGYDVYGVYQAIRLHFTDKNYNFFTYGGKTRVSVDTFNKRKDKYNFHKLARQYSETEIVPFLVSNFVHNDSQWSRDLIQEGAREIYVEWQRVTQAMSNVFADDVKKMMGDKEPNQFNELFRVPEGEYPELFTLLMQKDITHETVVILNNIFGFIPKWDKQISDTVIYPKMSLKIRKYGAFLTVDVAKYKQGLKTLLLAPEPI